MTPEKFTVEIIAPTGLVLKSNVNEVVIPSYEGEMGILKNHITIITFLRPGLIKIYNDSEEIFFVEDGTVEFAENTLLILTSTAKKLNEMENKIRDLTQNNDNNSDVLSPETIEAIDGFKAEMMSTRSQLRSVKFDLRRDVENLKRWVIALNVAIIPIIFAGLALIISLRRKKLFY